ncbi:CD2-associated protein-like isoform X1 [Xenia sp. Carnegie-2017]|uniref:CD2-associated protein-like isoform X1 n=1 Tax=Xenia sp. Carnegie-2017 TaxID=2897299 RepID=UPI001F03BA4A|nr:CD2-associated protein-like isoform X1 [Xenia sp. Carnegie-2017]
MSDAKVLFEYDAEADDELTLKEGDFIRNVVKKEDGWWEGELHGRRGMFPENFVEEIKRPAPLDNIVPEPQLPTNPMSDKSSRAKVTFDYDAENDDELTLKEGDIVKVLDQEEEGWWKGELKGKIGVFPSNFVELIHGPPPGPVESPPEPPKEPVTGEKKAKMMGGLGMGLTQDALSKVKLKKNTSGILGNGNIKSEKPVEPPQHSKASLPRRTAPPAPPATGHGGPKRPPLKGKERVVVEYDYDGEQSDELTLRVGNIVTVLEKDVSDGWSKGELNGIVGLFPDNFVKALPSELPNKEPEMTKSWIPDLPKKPPVLAGEDAVDNKPPRPEFPKLKKTNKEDRPPPVSTVNQTEIPVKLKPVPHPPNESVQKKPDTPPVPDSKPSVEDKPKLPIKKSPPLLPKKPEKPKQPEFLHKRLNNVDKDPTKRLSAAVAPVEKPLDAHLKRHSQGEIPVNFNDIKSNSVLQPLTSDRPKNPAKNPPTKYTSSSNVQKKTVPSELPDASLSSKQEKNIKNVLPDKPPAHEKPSKPIVSESVKPLAKPSDTKSDSAEVKKLKDDVLSMKNAFESLTKKFNEHAQKTEKQIQKLEKRFTDEIEDLTKELDEEKKLRSALDVEVSRLRKLIKNQTSS